MPDKKKREVDETVERPIVEVFGDDDLRKVRSEVVKKVEEEREELESADEQEREKEEETNPLKVEVVSKPEPEQGPVAESTVNAVVSVSPSEAELSERKAMEEEIGGQRGAKRGIVGVVGIVFLVLFAMTGWAFYLKTVFVSSEGNITVIETNPTPTAQVSPTPAPTPEPLTREEITLEILNGSGVAGLAGKTGTTFEELGYSVSSVGNAEENVDETQVFVRADLEDRLAILFVDLKSELAVASVAGYLTEDDDVSARIVLGE